jgi:hypothetical protein
MVHWQNASFPSLRRGFDSRYPLNKKVAVALGLSATATFLLYDTYK